MFFLFTGMQQIPVHVASVMKVGLLDAPPPSKCSAIAYLLKIAVVDITVSAALPLKVYIFFIKFLSTINKQMQLLHCKFCIFIQSYLKRPDNLFIYRSNKCIMPCALNKFKLEPFHFFFYKRGKSCILYVAFNTGARP